MFHTMKLGKRDPIPGLAVPHLDDYRKRALPPAPPTLNRYSGVDFQPFCNTEFGCCTIAAIANGIVQRTTLALGTPVVMPDAVVLASYAAVTDPPFNPATGANDNGAVETTVLSWFASKGVHLRDQALEIGTWGRLDGSPQSIRDAVHLFGSAYIGLALPLSAQNQTVWDVTKSDDGRAGSWGGHAVLVVGYDADGVTLATWGTTQRATWAFLGAYMDEAYAQWVPGEWLGVSGLTPDHYDFAALASAHQALAG